MRLTSLIATVLATAGTIPAQLYLGSVAGDAAGTSGAVTVDLDLNGTADIAQGAPSGLGGAGYLRMWTQTLGTWFDFNGVNAGDNLGADVISADLNADGFLDLVVVAPGAGLIYAIDGFGLLGWGLGTVSITSAPLLWTAPQAALGTDVEAGDLDGNGTLEVVAASPSMNTVYVYNGQTGALQGQFAGPTGAYGTSVCVANVHPNPGDEIVVADPVAFFGAFAWIECLGYAAGTITPLTVVIPPTNPATGLDVAAGTSLVAGADYTGDGFEEVWAGGTANGCGYFILDMNASTVNRQFFLNGAGTGFGQAIAVVPDTTGDGIAEYAIGAPGANQVGVFDGATGAYIASQVDPFPATGSFGSFLLPIVPGISAGPPAYNVLVGAPASLAIGALWLF